VTAGTRMSGTRRVHCRRRRRCWRCCSRRRR
jgi:hypothetical protein